MHYLTRSSWQCAICTLKVSELEVRRSWGSCLRLHSPLRRESQGFPGGAVVKNMPANAEDTVLSPGAGRSHTARAPQLLKPGRLELVLHNKRSHRNEKPTHHNEE